MTKLNMNLPTETKPRVAGRLKMLAALGIMAASLSGCIVYPNGGYGGGYYAPAPAYYAPPVAFDFGWGGGWGHRGWR